MWLEYYVLTMVFIFGAVIGSFLNVVIYRLHTGKSINGASHCLSCGRGLRWFELFPLVSYLTLRGRCRTCGSYVPLRYLLVEFLTAVSFLGLWLYTTDVVIFGFLATLIALLVVTTVYDFYHLIIPNELPVSIGVVGLLYQGYLWWQTASSDFFLSGLMAAVIASGFYAFLWVISKGRWIGLGDAKLALPLGLFLPASAAVSMVILSFWVGALISLLLLALQWCLIRGKISLPFFSAGITMKSEVPFAPFIITAFLITFFWSFDVTESTSYVLTWLL